MDRVINSVISCNLKVTLSFTALCLIYKIECNQWKVTPSVCNKETEDQMLDVSKLNEFQDQKAHNIAL